MARRAKTGIFACAVLGVWWSSAPRTARNAASDHALRYSPRMASTPKFVRFVRALALVSGSALAACSGAPASDAGSDGAVSDSAAPSDSATDSGGSVDSAVDAMVLDTGTPSDAGADAASEAGNDAMADAGRDSSSDAGADAASDAASDAMAEASTCPETAPMSGTVCSMSGASCMWTEPGGAFTQCDCEDTGRWMCFTAVPGPLPPPELAA